MSDTPTFDPSGVDFGTQSADRRPPLLGGVGPAVDDQGVPIVDDEGREIPRPVFREEDWGYETRVPGGGLSYRDRRSGQLSPRSTHFPQFRDGDQYDIYSFTPQRLSYLQRSLVAAGLLDPEDIEAYGYVGPAGTDSTFDAYERAMEFANQAGYDTVDQALISLQSGRYGTGPGGTRGQAAGSGGGRLPSQISNSDDLRRVFRAAVIDELGRGWDDGRIDAMVNTYQAMERGQVDQAEAIARAAAERSEVTGEDVSSGTIEGLPDPSTFAVNYARQQDPTGAQATDFLGAANTFFSLLGQWNPPAGDLPDGT